MTQLQWLDISYNQLTQLPSEIGQLRRLRKLDLRGNLLPLPPEILEKVGEPSSATHVRITVENERGLVPMLCVGMPTVSLQRQVLSPS